MTKQKEIRTTEVSYDDYASPEFKNPARYYIKSVFNYVFIHVKTRELAQQWVDENYGRNFYLVRSYGLEKTKNTRLESGTITAKG